jgi:hypothetical protein
LSWCRKCTASMAGSGKAERMREREREREKGRPMTGRVLC